MKNTKLRKNTYSVVGMLMKYLDWYSSPALCGDTRKAIRQKLFKQTDRFIIKREMYLKSEFIRILNSIGECENLSLTYEREQVDKVFKEIGYEKQ